MAGKRFIVCFWHKGKRPICRRLSAKQHANAREAAETVLMQNPRAYVTVISPRGGGRGTTYKRTRTGKLSRVSKR